MKKNILALALVTIFVNACKSDDDAMPQINANFSASELTILEGSSISFTDQSTNNPTQWSWNFEGGTPSSSTVQNPTVLYETTGAFNVSLTASNSGSSDEEIKSAYINVSAKLVADFIANDSVVNADDEIEFTDISMGLPTGWEWTFEGGTPAGSSDQNPIVTYSTPGVHEATLKVTNDLEPNGNIITKQIVVIPTNGLVAYFPFSGDANDMSQNSFNGTASGAILSTNKNELSDESYQFDGVDDYITTSSEIDELLENGFTFSAWIYLDQLEANKSYTIFSNYNGDSPTGNCNTRIGIHFRINNDGSTRIFYAWDGNDRFGRDSDSGIIQLNTWYNVVAVWDGNIATSGFKLYLDGARVDTSDYSEGFFNCGGYLESLDPFRIGINECGGPPAGPCQPFSGKIDELRVYDRPLNATEIFALSKT